MHRIGFLGIVLLALAACVSNTKQVDNGAIASEDGAGGKGFVLEGHKSKLQRAATSVPKRPPQVHKSRGAHQDLSYWIERMESSGSQKVSTSTVFRSGDRIRFYLRSTRPGYLYVVNRDSTEQTTVLFPSAQGTDEYIQASQTIALPVSGWIRFDNQPGVETVWIFVSQRPLLDAQKAQAPKKSANPPAVQAAYNACGDKGMFVESPDALQTSCGGDGDKGLTVEEGDTFEIGVESEPVAHVSMPLEDMDKGHMLSVRFELKHQ